MTSEKAGDLIRKRLNGTSNGPSNSRKTTKTPISNVTQKTQRRMDKQDVNTLINNLIAMS